MGWLNISPPRPCLLKYAGKDLYQVLGLKRTCTHDEVNAAFHNTAWYSHADKYVNEGLTERSRQHRKRARREAYRVLYDPTQRKQYDECLQRGDGPLVFPWFSI